ncbi:MAG: M24 family metallopeptidase, partial [Pseudomonadota bacterium]
RMLKPGADPKEIWETNNAFLQKKGFFPERRLYAHGQGYDLVERPAIRYDEPMKMSANMNITVHPFAVNEKIWATLCDNFLVTETGEPVRIHKTPREIIVL